MARRTAQRRDSRLIGVLRRLYEGESRRALWFRYGLLAFDIATLCFLVLASLIDASSRLDFIELVIGLIILADFIARLLLSRRRFHDLFHPLGLADMAVIISFLIPVSGQGFGFLVALRLFRFYRVGKRMHRDFPFVRRHYDVILAGTHLFVFLFVMTAVVYETQHRHNRAIANYVDALYFTHDTDDNRVRRHNSSRNAGAVAHYSHDARRHQSVSADGASTTPPHQPRLQMLLLRAGRT